MSERFRFVDVDAGGVLVAAPIDDAHIDTLAPEERALATSYAARRMRTFATGRAVLKEALTRAGGAAQFIGRSARGAPLLPTGYRGSLSHKDELAVALVTRTDDDVTVGVDVELVGAATRDIASHVLTAREIDALAHLDDTARARAVLERFSVKEAFYKAIDPRLARFVGFHEVEADIDAAGAVRFTTPVLDAHRPRTVEGRVRAFGEVLVSEVRVRW